MTSPPRTPGADLDRAIRHYDQLAPTYDHATRRIDGVRAKAIEALGLKAGDVVLDAGCGTGFCFAIIEAAIGPTGRLIGFEPSPAQISAFTTSVGLLGMQERFELLGGRLEIKSRPNEGTQLMALVPWREVE